MPAGPGRAGDLEGRGERVKSVKNVLAGVLALAFLLLAVWVVALLNAQHPFILFQIGR